MAVQWETDRKVDTSITTTLQSVTYQNINIFIFI